MLLKKMLASTLVLGAILSTSVTAIAATNSAPPAAKRSTTFEFWIENRGPSSHAEDSAYKSDNLAAYVSVDDHSTYWPRDGVVFRVRNEDHEYATEAKYFDSGESQMLDYLSGQNYKGEKWLYASVSDSLASDYSLLISGEWIP